MAAFVLASASPRRRELLAGLGLAFDVAAADIPEVPGEGEPPEAYVARLAREKAAVAAERAPGRVVLAADTEVVHRGRALGKPRDEADALAMLRSLAGETHEVISGVCVRGAREETFTVRTRVRFRAASEAELRWYASTGEPLGKAGAYAVQGKGGVLVEAIEGSHSNVIGLPLAEAVAALGRAGVPLPWGAP